MKYVIDPSVSTAALRRFWDELNAADIDLHCLNIRLNDQPLVRWSAAPYECTDKREVYSLSKSFCSTAMGLAYDRGLVDPADKLLKYFPEYVQQCAADERWQHMTLSHLMSMNTGHANPKFPDMVCAQDSVAAFFAMPLAHEPGTRFVYNTGATCMMAEIVRRVTGMTVPEWLSRELFPALDIDSFDWRACEDGHCQGGTGLQLCCDDLVKLGQLYLNEGMWQGKRLLSREWVQLASSAHSDNNTGDNPNPDWCAGYGFQFWRNARLGYRGDGAYGQLCVILPEKQMVVAMQAEAGNMQAELNAVWTLVEALIGPEQAELPEGFTPKGTLDGRAWDSGWRSLDSNLAYLTGARLKVDANGAKLWLSDESHTECLIAPSGCWQENTLHFAAMLPSMFYEDSERTRLTMRISAAARAEGNAIVLECRSRNTPHAFTWSIRQDEQSKLRMELLSPFGVLKHIQQICEK